MNCENQVILDHVLVYAHIKDIRRIAGLGFQHAHSIVLDKLAYWTLLVVAIAENARANWTNLDASRLQPLGNAVVTPGALVGDVLFLIEEARAVRASLHAILAADAVSMIDDDDAILGFVGRAGRTYLHAGRIRAVIAQLRHKEGLLDIGVLVPVGETIFALLGRRRDIHRVMLAVDSRFVLALQGDVALDPGAEVIRVQRNVVFLLAGLDATQAADACFGIDVEPPLMPCPIVSWYRRLGGRCCCRGGRRCRRRYRVCSHCRGAACDGASETTQKIATLLVVWLKSFVLVHLQRSQSKFCSPCLTCKLRRRNRPLHFRFPNRSNPSRSRP